MFLGLDPELEVIGEARDGAEALLRAHELHPDVVLIDLLMPVMDGIAAIGTIRREFGSTIMVNAAHASDSPENAQREMGIVKITENNMRTLIESWYAKK